MNHHTHNEKSEGSCERLCRLEGCNNIVPPGAKFSGYCCANHMNAGNAIRRGKATLEDYSFKCCLCDAIYTSKFTLSKHLVQEHGLDKKAQEEYYNKYVRTENDPDGYCKWCGKPTKFNTIGTGYDKFCGSRCSVLWYNKNTDRLEKSGRAISKAMSRGNVTATQLGYWMSKGLSEEEAREALRNRQTTNSVEAIMAREGISLSEAITKRNEITAKWVANRFVGRQWSMESQELFWQIWNTIKNFGIKEDDVFFATFDKGNRTPEDSIKNMEFQLNMPPRRYRKLDFYIQSLNMSIEYEGGWFHTDVDEVMWTSDDKFRDYEIKQWLPGHFILHIRSTEFKRDKMGTVLKCCSIISERMKQVARENQHKAAAS